jgi:hypothetical protein
VVLRPEEKDHPKLEIFKKRKSCRSSGGSRGTHLSQPTGGISKAKVKKTGSDARTSHSPEQALKGEHATMKYYAEVEQN